MSPKQAAYLMGPRTAEQKKILSPHVGRPKKQGPATCADCRHSQCTRTGTAWEFVCTLKHALAPATCADFKDSRKPTWIGIIPEA